MFVTLIVLTLIAAVLLIGVVLIQKSKGGGLSSSFAGSPELSVCWLCFPHSLCPMPLPAPVRV